MTLLRKYLIPIFLGFAGMFAAHIIILLGFGFGISIPLYFVSYPLVYSLLALLLTRRFPNWWLSNTIGILLIPVIYWIFLMWDINKLHWKDALTFTDAGGMLLILPFTFLIAVWIAFAVSKQKKGN